MDLMKISRSKGKAGAQQGKFYLDNIINVKVVDVSTCWRVVLMMLVSTVDRRRVVL